MLADHARPVCYELPTRAEPNAPIARPALYIHAPRGRAARTIDRSTERFVDETPHWLSLWLRRALHRARLLCLRMQTADLPLIPCVNCVA